MRGEEEAMGGVESEMSTAAIVSSKEACIVRRLATAGVEVTGSGRGGGAVQREQEKEDD